MDLFHVRFVSVSNSFPWYGIFLTTTSTTFTPITPYSDLSIGSHSNCHETVVQFLTSEDSVHPHYTSLNTTSFQGDWRLTPPCPLRPSSLWTLHWQHDYYGHHYHWPFISTDTPIPLNPLYILYLGSPTPLLPHSCPPLVFSTGSNSLIHL